MKVIAPGDVEIDLGSTEEKPTIGITDYSRRETDAFGVTTVVPRAFARRMSLRFQLPNANVDTVQNALAELRATPAQWVAQEEFAWLNFEGFYKDFNLDHQTGEVSFCSLTVEGLAESETVADGGEDPAPLGASSLLLIQPVDLTAAHLVASDVAEADYAEWADWTIYALGARVISTTTHRIYESVVANNVANEPTATPAVWLDVGPTNRWAMFDQALGTATVRNGGIAVTLAPGAVDAVALLDVVGAATVRVQGTGYDQIKAAGAGPITFLDLPGAGGDIVITVAGAGAVSVGTLLVGTLVGLGLTETSPTSGITDYSRKEVDDFGDATIVERAWAKKSTQNALIRTDAVDIVANRIAAVRARPSLWIAAEGSDALTIYGYFKEFSIEVSENVSKLALTIEGLSKAAPIVLDDSTQGPPTSIAPTPPASMIEGALWIAPDGHPYRFGSRPWTSNSAPWTSNGEAWIGGGWADAQDQVGVQAAAVAAAVTAQVARIASDNWLTAAEKSGLVLSHKAMIENHIALNAKAAALGVAATERTNATAAVNALNAYLVSLSPAWNDTTTDTPATAATITTLWGNAATTVALLQAAVQGLPGPEGDPGIDGVDGKGVEFVWKRSALLPDTPTGNGIPAGWSDDPPAGAEPLWMSKAKQELDGTLVAGEAWSTPVRQDGIDGADGAPGLTISASPPVFNVARTPGGAPKAGELPKTLQVQVLDGDTDVTALCSFGKTDTGCSVSDAGDGEFTLTALSAEDAFTVIVATYGTRSIPIKIAVAQARDGSAASRASGTVTSMNASGSYVAIATIDIVAAAGTTISASASVNYTAASFVGTGTRTVRQRAKVSIENFSDGGAPSDGAAVIGSAASYIGGDGPSDIGSVSAGHSVTNSTGAPKTFRVKFLIQYYDGATTVSTAGGTYSGSIEAQVS